MTTIINTPSGTTEDSSVGVVSGIIFGILVVVLFLIFGLPYLRNGTYPTTPAAVPNGATTVNVTTPPTPVVTTGTTK